VSAGLFCDIELAARIERAEADLMAAAATAARARFPAGFVVPIAGGVATFAEPDSPFNKVAGLGFDGDPADADLAAVEAAFAAVGSPVQIELAHLASPSLAAGLTRRGYRLESFENVLGRAVEPVAAPAPPSDVVVEAVGAAELDAWVDLVVAGVAAPDLQGLPSHEDFPAETVARAERDLVAAGARCYLARRDGRPAGGASMRIAGGVAQLTGAATILEHRRHGVQSALLAARLADASAAGCEVAVVTTQPGSKSQQNVQRQGFDLLYARTILIREG
jgi:GNAT superfamily N-acetyltransferase